MAVSRRGQEKQSPVLVPHPGLLRPRLLLPGPQPAGEWTWHVGAVEALPSLGEPVSR